MQGEMSVLGCKISECNNGERRGCRGHEDVEYPGGVALGGGVADM